LDRPVEPATNETERLFVRLWTEILGVSPIGITDNFFELGGDSLIALKMTTRAQEAGIDFTVEQLFKSPTVQELAKSAAIREVTKQRRPEALELPVLPVQEEILSQGLANNHCTLLTASSPFDISKLRSALYGLADRHPALRLRFVHSESGWKQKVVPLQECSLLQEVDLRELSPEKRNEALDQAIREPQQQMARQPGDSFQAILFHLSEQEQYLFLQMLELAADKTSWNFFLEELESSYLNGMPSEPEHSAHRDVLVQWRDAVERYTGFYVPREKSEQKKIREAAGPPPLPSDRPSGTNSLASADIFEVSLDAHQCRPLLEELPGKFHCEPATVLLTALLQAISRWSGIQQLAVETLVDARNVKLDQAFSLETSLGPYTLPVISVLELGKSAKGPDALKAVKEQMLRESRRVMAQKWGHARQSSGSTAYLLKPELKFTCNADAISGPR